MAVRPKRAVEQRGLVGPSAQEVVIPGPGLEVEIEEETKRESGKRIICESLGPQIDLFPVAVLLVDVRAGLLARGAFHTRGIRRLAEAVWLGVDLLDQGDRGDIVAPWFPGKERPHDERRDRDQHEEDCCGLTNAVDAGGV